MADMSGVIEADNTRSRNMVPGAVGALPGAAWVVLALIGLATFNWRSFGTLVQAWSKPEYSHGWIIAPIAAYLFLRAGRNAIKTTAAPNRLPGALMFTTGLAVSLLGNLALIPDVIIYGFLLSLGGLVLIVAGMRDGFRFWPAWLYLSFLLPMPNSIYWPLSVKLQFISSRLGVLGIKAMSIPVYLEGNIIDLGTFQLQVAEACNGLRYLFPLMSFGFLFAALYRGPAWHKLAIFLSSIPITIFMNSFRIAVIGALVDKFGIGQAEGFLHSFEGWVVFLACLVLLYTVAWLLQRLVPRPQPVYAVLDLDTHGLATQFRHLTSITPSKMLQAAALFSVIVSGLWLGVYQRPDAQIERQRLEYFPMSFAGWRGIPGRLDLTIERVLAASDYLVADYSRAADSGSPINFLVAYYRSQGNGSGIHSPEVCIPGSGWEVSKWAAEDVSIAGVTGGSIHLNRAIVQKGASRQLVYYWFEQQGQRFSNDYAAKAFAVYGSILRGRSDGALVRAVTAIDSRGPEAADERLRHFIAEVVPELPRFVPP